MRTRRLFIAPHPRLGHAARIVRLGRREGQIMLAVGYALEPRPTNAVEDEDDEDEDQYDYDCRRLPTNFLQSARNRHSFLGSESLFPSKN